MAGKENPAEFVAAGHFVMTTFLANLTDSFRPYFSRVILACDCDERAEHIAKFIIDERADNAGRQLPCWPLYLTAQTIPERTHIRIILLDIPSWWSLY
jgi:hypothetical protein